MTESGVTLLNNIVENIEHVGDKTLFNPTLFNIATSCSFFTVCAWCCVGPTELHYSIAQWSVRKHKS